MTDPLVLYAMLQAMTVVFVVLTLDGIVRAVRAEADRGVVVGLVVVVLVALMLRLWAPWGPHDINDRIRLLVSWLPQLQRSEYGWGRPAFWRTILQPQRGGPYDLALIAHATAVVGALSVGALGVWARLHGAGRVTLGVACGLMAIDPLLVRFGHTDAPQIHEILPFLIGLAGWTAHTIQPSWRSAALGTSGVVLAATMRPESVLLLVPVALIGWAQGRPLPWRRADTAIGLALVVVLPMLQVAHLWALFGDEVSRRAGWDTAGPLEHGVRHWIVFQPDFVSPLLGGVVAAGALVAPGSWPRRLGWGIATLALGVFVPGALWSAGVGDVPLLARHQLRMLPLAWLLAGFAAAHLARGVRQPVAVGAIALAVVGLRAIDLHHLTTPWTIHEEHAAFRAAAAEVPPGCRLLAFRTRTDTGLVPPLQEIDRSDRDGWRYLEEDDPVDAGEGCVWWWRGGLCSVARAEEGEAAWCDRFEAAHHLTPVREHWLADHPWLYDEHRADPVRVGLYRVDGVR